MTHAISGQIIITNRGEIMFSPQREALIARSMGPIWGRQDPGGPHVGPMNFAVWGHMYVVCLSTINCLNMLFAKCGTIEA